MRLPVDRLAAIASVLILGSLPAACGGGGEARPVAAAPVAPTGPAADYPMVIGAPFAVNGTTYTPADTLNYDQVGYAAISPDGGAAVSIAHRTLPLPSYVEVTSLKTGKTILARVERRGPMSGAEFIALSPGAAAQLGTDGARTPVRVRRVNPPEPERALLRAGQHAPQRMDTPMPLVAVLMRKLEPQAPVAAAAPPATAVAALPSPPAAAAAAPVVPVRVANWVVRPVVSPKVAPVAAPVAKAKAEPAAAKGAFAVQVGTFASEANARKAAASVGGTVSPAGKLFRVRVMGLAGNAQAAAALAKVKAAGYSDARIQHAD